MLLSHSIHSSSFSCFVHFFFYSSWPVLLVRFRSCFHFSNSSSLTFAFPLLLLLSITSTLLVLFWVSLSNSSSFLHAFCSSWRHLFLRSCSSCLPHLTPISPISTAPVTSRNHTCFFSLSFVPLNSLVSSIHISSSWQHLPLLFLSNPSIPIGNSYPFVLVPVLLLLLLPLLLLHLFLRSHSCRLPPPTPP